MKKINNKGYMLVEIILAFSIAFILLYFIMDLVIKLKNKNDDLLVETLVKTDQTIIINKLMDYAIAEEKDFDCEKLKEGIVGNSVNYGEDIINIVNKYTVINKDNFSCSTNLGKVSIVIPLEVKQMSDKNFDVIIDYKYDIGDMIPPTCSLSVSGNTISAEYSDNQGESGIIYAGWNSNFETDESDTKIIDATGNYKFYVKDMADNVGECSVDVTTSLGVCPEGYSEYGGNQCRLYVDKTCGLCNGSCKSYQWICQGYHNPVDDECHGSYKKVCIQYYQQECNCVENYDYIDYIYQCPADYASSSLTGSVTASTYCYK